MGELCFQSCLVDLIYGHMTFYFSVQSGVPSNVQHVGLPPTSPEAHSYPVASNPSHRYCAGIQCGLIHKRNR